MTKISRLIDPIEETRFKKRNARLLNELLKTTHFNKTELDNLCVIFYKLTIEAKERMDRERFIEVMHVAFEMTGTTLMDRMFSLFERHQYIDLENWAKMMSLFLRGSLDERINYVFSVYDQMSEGFLSKEGIFHLMRNFMCYQSPDEDVDESVMDMVDVVIRKMDLDRDGKLSFADFRDTVKKNPSLLQSFGECMPARNSVHTFLTVITTRVGRF